MDLDTLMGKRFTLNTDDGPVDLRVSSYDPATGMVSCHVIDGRQTFRGQRLALDQLTVGIESGLLVEALKA